MSDDLISETPRFGDSGRPKLRGRLEDPLQYFEGRFREDVACCGWLSVAHFCPTQYASESFKQFQDQHWFLSSLFVTNLVDQAAHSITGLEARRPLLKGFLSSSNSIMHPGHLLLLLGLYRLPRSLAETIQGIMVMIESEGRRLIRETSRASLILDSMLRGLLPENMPQSLAPFLPHGEAFRWQPDPERVEVLRSGIVRRLERLHQVTGQPGLRDFEE